jgi:hypothetical protein
MEHDIPTDPDDLLRNPPTKTDLGDWFTDPEDALSLRNNLNRPPQDRVNTTEGLLRKKRELDDTISRGLDDSIFGRLTKSLKGATR